MGIIDRLSDVIRSYLNEDSAGYDARQPRMSADPDVRAAQEELDEFLNQGKKNAEARYESTGGYEQPRREQPKPSRPAVPEALRPDFAELGLAFGASPEDCKDAYKKLLKVHHPDRHAGHAENMRKATEKSSRINAAYDRIEKWRQTGQV
jgi:DnaJ-class molecular chaperone